MKLLTYIKRIGLKKIFEKMVLGITYTYMILSPLYFNYSNIHMTYTPAVELLKKVWFIATLLIFIGNLMNLNGIFTIYLGRLMVYIF